MANFAVTPTDTTFTVQVGENTAAAANSAALAQAWAENDTAPGGAGTKSAKTWAGEAAASAASLVAAFNDPFPDTDFELPIFFRHEDVQSPSSVSLTDQEGMVVANGQRFYAVPTIANFGFAVGEVVRVAMRRLSGTMAPPALSSRNGGTLVANHTWQQVGDYFFADVTIPETTTILRLDGTNSSGSSTKFSYPRFAKRRSFSEMPEADGLRLERFASRIQQPVNIWSGPSSISTLSGTGSGASAINADGSVTVTAGDQVRINSRLDAPDRDFGDPVTALVRVSSRNIRQVFFRFVGAGGEAVVTMRETEFPGIWRWSGNLPTISASSRALQYAVQVDNREPLRSQYTAADVIVSDFTLIDGLDIPDGVPLGGAVIEAASGQPVTWVKSGETVFVYARNATGDKTCRYTFSRKVHAPSNTDCFTIDDWSLGDMVDGVWTLSKDLTPPSEINTAIQTQQAIDHTADPDIFIWGGQTHGNMVHDVLAFYVDGRTYSLSTLPNSGAAVDGKFVVFASGTANDEGTATEALTGSSAYIIEHGSWETINEVRFSKINSVGPAYLGMGPFVQAGFDTMTINETIYPIAGSGDVQITNLIRPQMSMIGDDGCILFEALHHTGLCGVLITNRSGDPVPFRKAYFMAGGAQGKVTRQAGDRMRVHARYRHFS